MRWSYLIPRLIIMAIIWAFFAFGFDPALRYGATTTVQAITGAKADIESLTTGFFPPRMIVDRVALASQQKPGTNLMQFETLQLHLAGEPLLHKSFVIDEAKITGVRFGTSRSDNGQLEHTDEETSGPIVPPWLKDKLANIGDEWLASFTQQAKAQLDPNSLESYRVGQDIYRKWDTQFTQLRERIDSSKQEVASLKQQIESAKTGEPVQQIQRYLQVAQRADQLLRQSRTMIETFNRNIPGEVRQDFARLDQAQKNDRAAVAQRLQLLKPDARRISESLIGEQLYVQLQQLLTWIETARTYQQGMKVPPQPERQRGRTFEFPHLRPTPRLLCKKVLVEGEFMLGDTPTPFKAVLVDVTSDPVLYGRPTVLHVVAAGASPVEVTVRHDATTEVPETYVSAEYVDHRQQTLSAGKSDSDHLRATISDLRWKTRLHLVNDQISGHIDVASGFGDAVLHTQHEAATLLAGLTEQTLSQISTVNTSLTLDGPVSRPRVSMTSDLGDQIASGFQAGFQAFAPQAQQHMNKIIDQYVQKEKQALTQKLRGRYDRILAENKQIIAAITDAQTIVSDLRSDQITPNQVFRTASDSGLLKGSSRKKVGRYLDQHNKLLNSLKNPAQLKDAIPGLRSGILRNATRKTTP